MDLLILCIDFIIYTELIKLMEIKTYFITTMGLIYSVSGDRNFLFHSGNF